MKVLNKHPEYINSAERVKSINQAYTIVFLAINKMDSKLTVNSKSYK